MSKQADITFCKIAIIEGVFNTFIKENRFARVDIREAIKSGKKAIEHMAEIMATGGHTMYYKI